MVLSKTFSATLVAFTFTSTRSAGFSPAPSSSLRMLGFSNDKSLMYWPTTRTCTAGGAAPTRRLPMLPFPLSVGSTMRSFPSLPGFAGFLSPWVGSYLIAILAGMRRTGLLAQTLEFALDDGALYPTSPGGRRSWLTPAASLVYLDLHVCPLDQTPHAPARHLAPD